MTIITTKFRSTRTMTAVCTTALMAGGLALVGVAAPASATGGTGGVGEGHTPVTLCHAITPDTASAGWNELTVDDDAIVHAGHTEHSADIIPAFEGFDGLNLTESFDGATGQEILDNGCVAPEPTEPTEPTLVTPAVPSAKDECGTENDGIVVPADGIGYSYHRTDNAGSTTVTVVAATGYVFPAGTATEWAFTLTDEPCDVAPAVVVVSSATFVDPCGPDNDVLTLPTQEGVAYTETEHTDSVSGATVRVVTAAAAAGYVLSRDGQEVTTTSWEFQVNDTACEVIVPDPEVPGDVDTDVPGDVDTDVPGDVDTDVPADVDTDVTTPAVPTVVTPIDPAGVLSADTSVTAPVVAPVTPAAVRTDATLAHTGFNGAELGQLAALLVLLGGGAAAVNALRSARRSPAEAGVRR